MKYCSKCGKEMEDGNSYCPACGAMQNIQQLVRKKVPAIIITLSVITLLGSAFGALRGLFYQTMASLFHTSASGGGYERGYILFFLNVGTFVAAILMLNLKRSGYFMYLFFQSIYIAFTIYIMLIYSDADSAVHIVRGINPLVLLTGAFFWLPSCIMLFLFLTLAGKYFKKQA